MLFEDAVLVPASGAVDVDAVRRWLERQPWAFLDPVEGQLWYLSGTPRGSAWVKEQRLADPTRFPYGGVLVRLTAGLVALCQIGSGVEEQARGRQLVEQLLAQGGWSWQSEFGPRGVVRSADDLYPPPSPPPSRSSTIPRSRRWWPASSPPGPSPGVSSGSPCTTAA